MDSHLLAVVLGVLLGGALLVVPRTALQLSVFMGPTRRRCGDYGTDAPISHTWMWGIRALGVMYLAIAAVIAYQTYL
ncbi:hypothetical protein [Haloarcula nitratireducens]|uniref:Uncharacterized protein n=1 Tax=Haloarcula nitratireducens TaxID=2487749 RepID=A0AAW4PK16_9EURY|nr:hypothetical protein [Halomicroarcula nitratireducens]MBX0298339.1 hypothetical protein [Halomicroarcula nitratireducens]